MAGYQRCRYHILEFRDWQSGCFPQKGTDKLITDAIVCILKASDGKLWIGTLGGGLICYDNGRIIHYKKTYRNGKILWLIIMYWLWLKISRGLYG